MSIGGLTKKKGSRILGMDTSTNSLAFAVLDDGNPVRCGEIVFKGATVFDRLYDARMKTRALVASGDLVADYVAIEATIMARSINVAIDMAYVNGAIISELMVMNPQVHKIAPITWQSGIGNPNLKQWEKDDIKKQYPDRKPSFYLAEGRKIRKQRTLDIARKYFTIPGDSDNVGDAVGLALYASQTLTRR